MRNPFAPGAGQRPPELAGRDKEVDAFEIVLERVARGRPERSMVLTGLRGVGKTVLLGELRSMAMHAGWGAGKIEARPDADLRRPLSAALHRAIRDLAVRHEVYDGSKLGALRFAEEAGQSFRNEGMGRRTHDLTAPKCQEDFVENAGLPMRTVMCLRAYRHLPGLYDVAVLS